MTITVEKPPIALPLTGDPQKDKGGLHKWIVATSRFMDQIWQRTGGSADAVSPAAIAAHEGYALAVAALAGQIVPVPGGAVTITPSDPITHTIVDRATARISITAHSRSDAASELQAGTTDAVTRDATYYVYYVDPADLGGPVGYLATADLSDIDTAGDHRIVGVEYVEPASYPDRFAT